MMNPDTAWANMVSDLLDERVVEHNNRAYRRMPGSLLTFHATPLVTLRKTSWRNALRELEWLAYGNGYLANLHPAAQSWWKRSVGEDGCVPHVGFEIEPFLAGVRDNPMSRRNVLTSYSRGICSVPRNDFVLQATVDRGDLDLFVYQRTCDVMRGAMHNWIQYWALGMWAAHHAGLKMHRLLWVAGDIHLYEAHAKVAHNCVKADARHTRPNLQYSGLSKDFRADEFILDGTYQLGNTEPLEWL